VTEHRYSAADITVLSMADAVRKRPGMYFGVGRGDPRLATQVLCAVVGHAFHPAAGVADSHTPHVVADITADLAFSVTDDLAETLTGQDMPRLGYESSLLTPDRWSSAAAAAVSSQSTVEVWRDGQGFRQKLVNFRPIEPPRRFSAPAGAGTRVAYVLDPAYFGSAVIATDLAALDVHGPYCTDAVGPGEVVVRDHRNDNLWAGSPETRAFTKWP
jgi:DNA gyrase/topoisomerase IV subunit B